MERHELKTLIIAVAGTLAVAGCANGGPMAGENETHHQEEPTDNAASANDDYAAPAKAALDSAPKEVASAPVGPRTAAPKPESEAPVAAEVQAEPKMAPLERKQAAAGRVAVRTRSLSKKDADKDALEDSLVGSLNAAGAASAAGPQKSAQPGRVAPPSTSDPSSNSEHYTNYGVNEMTATVEDHLSTFSIDVDTGSYTIARRKLREGYIPPANSVRVEEFVNYFDYNYPNPDSGAFGVYMEAAKSPFSTQDDVYLMRVGVQGKRVSPAERKPVHLTFLVDVSGSMGSSDKLPLAKQSLKILTNNLHRGDTVALATYAGRVAEILPPTGIDKKSQIIRAIDQLGSGGSTAMNSGMELAYKLALKNFQREHVNRVIVVSDGDANIGPSSHQQIQNRIRHFVQEGVTLSTIGVGMGNYQDTMMEQLANNGNGNYYYIDGIEEARKVFGEQIDGTLEVIAKDVKIQVEFNPEAVSHYRLIGYENRDIADRDFRNDRVDAGEIGSGHSVTALYEIRATNPRAEWLGKVRVRAKKPDGYKAAESLFLFGRGDVRSELSETSKDFQFAAAVAGFAEILRESPYAKNLSLALIEEVASGATNHGQKDRQEFLTLVKKAKSLRVN